MLYLTNFIPEQYDFFVAEEISSQEVADHMRKDELKSLINDLDLAVNIANIFQFPRDSFFNVKGKEIEINKKDQAVLVLEEYNYYPGKFASIVTSNLVYYLLKRI